jgi:SAM-dependent methyltransferase
MVSRVMAAIADAGFARPRGVLGVLGGLILAVETRERQRWVVSRLCLGHQERVLEVGFGPGVALAEAARTASFVAGVDQSDVMLRMARRRNAAAIREGRVDLRLGRADALPYADGRFDKAFSVNSVKAWPDAAAGLREARRVLRPGGLLAVAWQPVPGEPRDAAALEALGVELAGRLREAVFERVRVERGGPAKTPVVCALGESAAL